ncbi:MAG: hypothetical protein ACTSO6_09970 [Promethearchaeota archaeon]
MPDNFSLNYWGSYRINENANIANHTGYYLPEACIQNQHNLA